MSLEEIKSKLATQQIKLAQIDPFSYCNAKCWFCPVRYTPNPREAVTQMPPEVFERIMANIDAEKGRLVAPDFNFIYTAHYNEVLLYKHLAEMFSTLRRYKIKTYVLTNGIPLTPERTDLISENKDVVVGICFNVPAFEPALWANRSGMSESLFGRLVDNLRYAEYKLSDFAANGMLSLQINSASERSFRGQGGWLTRGENFPADLALDPKTGELARQTELAKQMFRYMNVNPMPSPIDRAGLLDDAKIMSNKEAINLWLKKDAQNVVGCNNGREVGGRPFGWVHVNARGDAFICCNDYSFEYTFGNLATQSLQDIWVTDQHAEVIQRAFAGVCRRCASSVWG